MLVYRSAAGLAIYDVACEASAEILEEWVRNPKRSPERSLIAFNGSTSYHDTIETIRPDGTRGKTPVKGNSMYSMGERVWSPTGSHIAYTLDKGWSLNDPEIYVIKSASSLPAEEECPTCPGTLTQVHVPGPGGIDLRLPRRL